MLTERNGKQNKPETVILEELVPQEHLLRKMERNIDFSFINKLCKPYYSENNGSNRAGSIVPYVISRIFIWNTERETVIAGDRGKVTRISLRIYPYFGRDEGIHRKKRNV